MRPTIRLLDILVPAGLALLGAVILYQTYTTFAEAGAASGDALSNSALFPRWIAWGLIGTAVVITLQTLFGTRPEDDLPPVESSAEAPEPRPDRGMKRRALACFITIAVYFAALPWIGFYLSTSVLMIILFALLGARPIEAVALGIVVTVLTVLAFEQGLNVVFPVGRLGLV